MLVIQTMNVGCFHLADILPLSIISNFLYASVVVLLLNLLLNISYMHTIDKISGILPFFYEHFKY